MGLDQAAVEDGPTLQAHTAPEDPSRPWPVSGSIPLRGVAARRSDCDRGRDGSTPLADRRLRRPPAVRRSGLARQFAVARTALIGTALALLVSSASRSEQIAIPVGPTALRVIVFRPHGTGPFPAVIGLHGCGGLSIETAGLLPQYADWAERLVAAGMVVLFPDSYASRGFGNQCSNRNSPVRNAVERVADAKAARVWLQHQPGIAAHRISLLGWANGAIAALWAVRPLAVGKDDQPDFRSAVAFYPGCRRLSETAWSARVPTLLLVGSADDWTPAGPCEQMVAGAEGRSARVVIVVYPGAHHNFDDPDQPLSQRSNLAFSADGSGRAHVATDPRARQDALKRVPEWLLR